MQVLARVQKWRQLSFLSSNSDMQVIYKQIAVFLLQLEEKYSGLWVTVASKKKEIIMLVSFLADLFFCLGLFNY